MKPATGVSYCHRGGDRPLIGVPIDVFLKEVMERCAENEAVVSLPQGERVTYRQLDERVEALARGLIALDVERGDRVAIWSTDNVEWITVQLAAARIGAILVNINPAHRVRELEHALALARVQVLLLIPSFRSSDYVRMMCDVCPELETQSAETLRAERLPALRHVVVYDPDDPAGTTRPAPGFRTWSDVIALGTSVADTAVAARGAQLDPDDAINIQFTSGTTGLPKAVILTHHSILNNAFFTAEAMGFTERDRLCVPVPFYHSFGLIVSNLACLTHGAAVVIPAPHFDAEATLTAIDRERCTALHGVPTMFIAELEHPDFARYDLSSLRTGIMGGAPCPPALLRRVTGDMGCREILIAYGMTESSPITHVTRRDDGPERRAETVGTNLPHQEVKVVDPSTGATVPLGEVGEVCVRGYHVMRGYFDQAAATQAVIDHHGWLHSGDLGAMDGDGYLRITGRLKDMIIRGGENIYPAEIEAYYCEHPKIAEVTVFGLPDEALGEQVAAWFKLHEGATADAEELRQWGRERIAHFKVPRHVWIVDEFPMTATGKIQKFRVREIAMEWLARKETVDTAKRPG